MISLQPLHFTHSPSGTWIRLCSTGCLGFLIFLNQAISISSHPSRRGSTAREWRGSYRHLKTRSRTASWTRHRHFCFRVRFRLSNRASSLRHARTVSVHDQQIPCFQQYIWPTSVSLATLWSDDVQPLDTG